MIIISGTITKVKRYKAGDGRSWARVNLKNATDNEVLFLPGVFELATQYLKKKTTMTVKCETFTNATNGSVTLIAEDFAVATPPSLGVSSAVWSRLSPPKT